ncbi:MMPL family transporter [Kitasatospora sp. NPDC058048]|uniref:MMPL family transporter n=1 Tax=Kitasatospora sp. NPDC058048 TaxID=3346313 RepID=UPI0036DBD1F4
MPPGCRRAARRVRAFRSDRTRCGPPSVRPHRPPPPGRPPVLSEDRQAARIDLFLTADSQSQQARDLVSGPIRAAVDRDLRLVFPVAAALIGVILLLLLRSLLAPVVLMLSVGLGFAATPGAAALLFQHAMGKPGVALPLVLFVVALGTDYNILISDRIRAETEHPGPPRAAPGAVTVLPMPSPMLAPDQILRAAALEAAGTATTTPWPGTRPASSPSRR